MSTKITGAKRFGLAESLGICLISRSCLGYCIGEGFGNVDEIVVVVLHRTACLLLNSDHRACCRYHHWRFAMTVCVVTYREAGAGVSDRYKIVFPDGKVVVGRGVSDLSAKTPFNTRQMRPACRKAREEGIGYLQLND